MSLWYCPTWQGGGKVGLVQPVLAPFITEHANASSQRNMPADEPLRTICAQVKGGHFALVAPFLAPVNHAGDTRVHSVEEPIRTITWRRARRVRVDRAVARPRRARREGSEGEEAWQG